MQSLQPNASVFQFFLQLQYYRAYHEDEEESARSASPSDDGDHAMDDTRLNTLEGSVFDGMIQVL